MRLQQLMFVSSGQPILGRDNSNSVHKTNHPDYSKITDGYVCTDCFLDLAFIVDSSDSIQEADPENGQYKNWDLILQFIISIIKRFLIGPSDTRVSVVVFATDAYVEFKLDAYDTETELIAKVKSIGYRGGNTNTAEALRLTTDGNASTVLPPI